MSQREGASGRGGAPAGRPACPWRRRRRQAARVVGRRAASQSRRGARRSPNMGPTLAREASGREGQSQGAREGAGWCGRQHAEAGPEIRSRQRCCRLGGPCLIKPHRPGSRAGRVSPQLTLPSAGTGARGWGREGVGDPECKVGTGIRGRPRDRQVVRGRTDRHTDPGAMRRGTATAAARSSPGAGRAGPRLPEQPAHGLPLGRGVRRHELAARLRAGRTGAARMAGERRVQAVRGAGGLPGLGGGRPAARGVGRERPPRPPWDQGPGQAGDASRHKRAILWRLNPE
jgi:hypothetical protein